VSRFGDHDTFPQCRSNAFCLVKSCHVLDQSWHIFLFSVFFSFPAFLAA